MTQVVRGTNDSKVRAAARRLMWRFWVESYPGAPGLYYVLSWNRRGQPVSSWNAPRPLSDARDLVKGLLALE